MDRVYVCNDASADRTREKVEEFMKMDGRVALINHEVNTGVGGAIIDCHKAALQDGMDIVAVMAGDDQMDPAYLPQLLDPLIDGRADYTKGNRLYAPQALEGMSRWRYTGNFILTLISKFATGNWEVKDPQNGYTAITADALRKLPLDGVYKGYLFENDMLVKLNAMDLRIMDVPIPARYQSEVSGINYYSFITRGLLFLVRAFLWRVKVKYVAYYLRPPTFFRTFGTTLFAGGWLLMVVMLASNWSLGRSPLEGAEAPLAAVVLGPLLFIVGVYMGRMPQRTDEEEHRA